MYFLNQANRARQSEAQTYVGSVNRAQQAYRLENTEFADAISKLGIGIPVETEFYHYGNGTDSETLGEIPSGQIGNSVQAVAKQQDEALRGYLGVTFVATDQQGNATTVAGLCQGRPNAERNTPTATISNAGGNASVTFGGAEDDCADIAGPGAAGTEGGGTEGQ